MFARASKFKIAKNKLLNYFKYEFKYFKYEVGNFKHFENFRARVIAHIARTKRKNTVFCCCLDLTSDTFLSRFTNFRP